MQLAYRESSTRPRRQHSLDRSAEIEFAAGGAGSVMSRIHRHLPRLSFMSAQEYQSHEDYTLLNSLIWVYVQMETEMIRRNIYILMAWSGHRSINRLAKAMGMNASFVARFIEMKDAVGFGCWNVDTLFRLAYALDRVRPELLLSSDLGTAVSDQVVNWQV